MVPAWLSMLDGFAAIVLIAGGIALAHLEILPAMMGLQAIILGVIVATLAFLIGIVALIRTSNPRLRAGRPKAIIGTLLGLATVATVVAFVVQSYGSPSRFPLINDITTDFANPPVFIHAPTLKDNADKDMGYQRARLQAAQAAYYGSVVPLRTSDPPAITFEHVKIVASAMPDWTITYTDPKRFALEGVATSPLMHFKDDFAIEVRPAGAGSEIEMRSKSRDGLGDFGANAARIQTFFAMFVRDQSNGESSAGSAAASAPAPAAAAPSLSAVAPAPSPAAP